MDFRFEDVEEAFFADLLAGFGAFEDRAGFVAEGAEFWSHGGALGFGRLKVKLEAWRSDRAEERGVRVVTRSAGRTLIPPTVKSSTEYR